MVHLERICLCLLVEAIVNRADFKSPNSDSVGLPVSVGFPDSVRFPGSVGFIRDSQAAVQKWHHNSTCISEVVYTHADNQQYFQR